VTSGRSIGANRCPDRKPAFTPRGGDQSKNRNLIIVTYFSSYSPNQKDIEERIRPYECLSTRWVTRSRRRRHAARAWLLRSGGRVGEGGRISPARPHRAAPSARPRGPPVLAGRLGGPVREPARGGAGARHPRGTPTSSAARRAPAPGLRTRRWQRRGVRRVEPPEHDRCAAAAVARRARGRGCGRTVRAGLSRPPQWCEPAAHSALFSPRHCVTPTSAPSVSVIADGDGDPTAARPTTTVRPTPPPTMTTRTPPPTTTRPPMTPPWQSPTGQPPTAAPTRSLGPQA
jgi:hypothetical protein